MKNGNQPTNPVTTHKIVGDEIETQFHTGLTKREYFAAMAMQGLISGRKSAIYLFNNDKQIETYTRLSIELSDSLLKQLEQTNNINPQK